MNPVMHGHDCASSHKVVSQVQIFILQSTDFISQSQDFISFCFVSQSTISSNSPLFFFFVCHFEFSATVQWLPLFRDSHSLLPVLVTSQVNNQQILRQSNVFRFMVIENTLKESIICEKTFLQLASRPFPFDENNFQRSVEQYLAEFWKRIYPLQGISKFFTRNFCFIWIIYLDFPEFSVEWFTFHWPCFNIFPVE